MAAVSRCMSAEDMEAVCAAFDTGPRVHTDEDEQDRQNGAALRLLARGAETVRLNLNGGVFVANVDAADDDFICLFLEAVNTKAA